MASNVDINVQPPNTGRFDTKIIPRYQNAREAAFGNMGLAREWKNEIMDHLECYEIPLSWNDSHLDQLITKILNSMSYDRTDGLEARLIIAGASYMIRPGSRTSGRIIEGEKLGKIGLDWCPTDSTGTGSSSQSVVNPMTQEEQLLRTARIQENIDQTHLTINSIKKEMDSPNFAYYSEESQKNFRDGLQRGLDNLDVYNQMMNAELDAINNERSSSTQFRVGNYTGPSYNNLDRKFALFVFGFLFKLITKTPNNIIKSWEHKTERFKGFYFSEDEPMQIPVPSLKWLDNLKRQFSLDRLALHTALRLINKLEIKYNNTNTNEIGMIRYLFSTPLAYSGMHAYKLFCAAREKLKKEAAWVLSNLSSPHFQDALDTIYHIFNHFEEGSDDNKDPFNPAFRYARLVGSQYFPAIQTKGCAELTYCLGRVVAHFESSDSGFDPEEIVGTKNVSIQIKAVMRSIADNLVKAKIQEDSVGNADVVQRGFMKPMAIHMDDDYDDENGTMGPVIPTPSGLTMQDFV